MPMPRQTHTVVLLKIPDEFHKWLTDKLKEFGPEYERDYIMEGGAINLRDVAMVPESEQDD